MPPGSRVEEVTPVLPASVPVAGAPEAEELATSFRLPRAPPRVGDPVSQDASDPAAGSSQCARGHYLEDREQVRTEAPMGLWSGTGHRKATSQLPAPSPSPPPGPYLGGMKKIRPQGALQGRPSHGVMESRPPDHMSKS